jgi:hypothetical protein
MCEYCESGQPIAEEEENSICISRFGDLFLIFRGDQLHLWSVPINYCPMCSRPIQEQEIPRV